LRGFVSDSCAFLFNIAITVDSMTILGKGMHSTECFLVDFGSRTDHSVLFISQPISGNHSP